MSRGVRSGSTSTSSRKRGPARPKKRFGQHFLTDPAILRRIADAADLVPGDVVVEVGPGRGSLTAELAARGANVVAVEIDRELVPELRERFSQSPNVTVVEADALRLRVASMLRAARARPPYKLVANLPYNVGSAVVREFLESDPRPQIIVVLLQREVAEAMAAAPGAMSLQAVAVQVYGAARIVMRVRSGAFYPPPRVDSSLLRIDVAPRPRIASPLAAFFDVVRAGFAHPRKQVRNNLAAGLMLTRDEATALLGRSGIDPQARAQTLTVGDWDRITRVWLARPAP